MRPAETSWGKAIDYLLEKRGVTLGELCRAIRKERSQIYNWRFKGKNGPTVENVAAILQATSSTWHDWADAMAATAIEGRKSHKMPRDGPSKKTVREKYA